MRVVVILGADSSPLDKKLKMRGHVTTCTRKSYTEEMLSGSRVWILWWKHFYLFFNWDSNIYDLKF